METPRPKIAMLYESGSIDDPNSILRALTPIAEEIGFDSIVFDPESDRIAHNRIRNLRFVKEAALNGFLSAIITPAKEEYSHTSLNAELFREELGTKVPIYGLLPKDNGMLIDLGENSKIVYPFSEEFIQILISLRDSSHGVHLQLLNEIHSQMDRLLKVHKTVFPDLDADDDTRIVAAFLRWDKMLIPEETRKEFDNNIPRRELKKTDPSKYDLDMQKISCLPAEERRKLSERIIIEKTREKRNHINGGYAIDPISLIDIKLFGFGNHNRAATLLKLSVYDYYDARRKLGYTPDAYNPRNNNFLTGFLMEAIKPYETPFLIFDEIFESDNLTLTQALKTIKHILKEKIFIPITSDAKVIDENFIYEFFKDDTAHRA